MQREMQYLAGIGVRPVMRIVKQRAEGETLFEGQNRLSNRRLGPGQLPRLRDVAEAHQRDFNAPANQSGDEVAGIVGGGISEASEGCMAMSASDQGLLAGQTVLEGRGCTYVAMISLIRINLAENGRNWNGRVSVSLSRSERRVARSDRQPAGVSPQVADISADNLEVRLQYS